VPIEEPACVANNNKKDPCVGSIRRIKTIRVSDQAKWIRVSDLKLTKARTRVSSEEKIGVCRQ